MPLLQAVTLGLIALAIAPGYLFYFDVTPKVVILLAGTAGLLILAGRRRAWPRGPRLLAALLLLNASSLAVSTAFSSNRSLSLYGGTGRCFGALVQAVVMLFAWLVACQCTGRPDQVRTILRGVSIAGMVSAAYGIAQYFGWDPLVPRVAASYLAPWLLATVFLSLALARMEAGRGWRRVAQCAAAMALAAMLLTGTRAALLGLAAGGAVWFLRRGFRLPRGAMAAALLLVLCAAGFYYSPAARQLRGGARPLLWRDSFLMALKRPAAGFGPETFITVFPHYESRALAKAYPDSVHESPRNMLLDALVSQGVPGFLILCGLCLAGIRSAWRLNAGFLAAALTAGIVSQQFTAFTVPTAVLLLTTIAVIMGLAADAEVARGAPSASARATVLSAAAPLVALSLLYLAVRFTLADHALAVTRRHLEAGQFAAATAEYETYWFWHLPGASADLWYSQSWMEVAHKTSDLGVLEEAMTISGQAAERATQTAEEPFAAWYNLAQIAALSNDYDGAESSLRRAMGAQPNWFKPHWMLAQQLQLVSRLDEAEAEAALAVDLDNGTHPEVAHTLQDIRARRAASQ